MTATALPSPPDLAARGAGGGTDDSPTPARHAAPGEWLDGVAPRPDKSATSAGVTVHPETGLLPVATVQTPPEALIPPGSGPSENGHAPRNLTDQVIDVLEDDRMPCPEIRRQLAKTGVDVDEPRLALLLRKMTLAGQLTERHILDRPGWAAIPGASDA